MFAHMIKEIYFFALGSVLGLKPFNLLLQPLDLFIGGLQLAIL